MSSNKNIPYQVNSALFHVVDNLIISRNNLSFRVNKIFPEIDKASYKINNELRLKKFLFSEIFKKYNTRIQFYNLNFHNMPKSFLNKFELFSYATYNKNSAYSAYCSVFPRTFVCKKCGHFISFKNGKNEEFDSFDFDNCQLGCGGSYEQIFQMKFCETCGHLTPLSAYCKDHKDISDWKLVRKDKFQPITWKLSCEDCAKEKSGYQPKDILAGVCHHTNRSNEDPSKYTLLTATEGSVFHPIVLTMVDIPNPDIDSLYLDSILFGLYLHRFDKFLEENPCDSNDFKDIIQHITDFLALADNTVFMKTAPKAFKQSIEDLKSLLDELEAEFNDYSYVNINDHMVLSGDLSKNLIDSLSFDKFAGDNDELLEKYYSFKKTYKIDQVNYLSNINLISAVIGVNVGLNKFYEENFVPHFEPLWNDYDKNSIKSYIVPFETEGVMFNLNKCEVVNWLIDNQLLLEDYVDDEEEAVKILMSMEVESNEYVAVKKLIHTLSHSLIRRSSLYTGLQEDSCGEMLFVNSASFLIYSSSQINIGGFAFIFENALFDWFDGIKLDLNDCALDPSCIQESGACFSCLFLPEYVCCDFNNDLDRDVFTAKTDRFIKGFW